MSVFSIFGLALSVIALNVLDVSGEAIVTLEKIETKNVANDFFGDWSTEIHSTKKSSQLSVKLPTKEELPDTFQMKLYIQMAEGEPIEKTMSLCDALNDETIGKSFVDKGEPKDSFPKECPFGSGDWSVKKWDPPTDAIPRTAPEGPISGSVSLYEEGKDPIIVMEFNGDLKHK